jgi:hypothetical protein
MKLVSQRYTGIATLKRRPGLPMGFKHAKKRELFRRCRENPNNSQVKKYYKIYCKILKQVINEAKKQSFHKQIAASTDEIKTAWKIVKENSGNVCPDGSVTNIKYRDTPR